MERRRHRRAARKAAAADAEQNATDPTVAEPSVGEQNASASDRRHRRHQRASRSEADAGATPPELEGCAAPLAVQVERGIEKLTGSTSRHQLESVKSDISCFKEGSNYATGCSSLVSGLCDDVGMPKLEAVPGATDMENAAMCQKLCESVCSCTHFTWVHDPEDTWYQTCFLRRSGARMVGYEGRISSPVNCDEQSSPPPPAPAPAPACGHSARGECVAPGTPYEGCGCGG